MKISKHTFLLLLIGKYRFGFRLEKNAYVKHILQWNTCILQKRKYNYTYVMHIKKKNVRDFTSNNNTNNIISI